MSERTVPLGRPRSEDARLAVLRAVDNMLVEEGYAAMTMKGIAERAGVGRQTVYRWWSSKAEILLEASATDAARELTVRSAADPVVEVTRFLAALADFLRKSDAGLAYRALLGEAQHDRKVAALLEEADILGSASQAVIRRLQERACIDPAEGLGGLVSELVGPLLYRIIAEEWVPKKADLGRMAERFLSR